MLPASRQNFAKSFPAQQ